MDDAQAAVVQALTRPRQEPTVVRRSAGGWVSRLGGHVPARLETIRFRKARFWADYGLLAVEFEDEDDRRHFGVRGVTRQGDGAWTVSGGAGGGGWETSTATAPWANLGAWWDDRRFCAGGRVHGDAVRRLRLVDAAGRTVEDTVDEGIALVMHMGPFEQPWSVELYAADDTLLRRHPFHGGRPAAP